MYIFGDVNRGFDRIPNACRTGAKNPLNSEVDRGDWTREEDEALVELYKQHGPQWAVIAGAMPPNEEGKHRTDKQCRDRWMRLEGQAGGDS